MLLFLTVYFQLVSNQSDSRLLTQPTHVFQPTVSYMLTSLFFRYFYILHCASDRYLMKTLTAKININTFLLQ